MISQNTFFERIEVKQREQKHREKSLTMMVDGVYRVAFTRRHFTEEISSQ